MLIYAPSEGPPPSVRVEEQMPRWDAFTESLADAGLLVGADRLHGVDTAKTVRVRGGETQITDGPFAETKEYLAGYYLIDASDLDTALEWAARIPSSAYGSTEVRPMWQPPAGADWADAGA
jgi:hypothetical protein